MRRIRRTSDLTERVAQRLREAILRGDFGPGRRLRQEEVAESLGVSRAPVRQALVILDAEGLVVTEGSRGVVVAPLTVDMIRDLYEFRTGVERHVAECLAKRSDIDWTHVRALVAAGSRASTTDRAAQIDYDLRFHSALYDALGNRILSDVMRGQWINMRRGMAATTAIAGYSKQIWDEHAAILDAIVAQEPERAGALAAAHTIAASRRLIDQVQEDQNRPEPRDEAPGSLVKYTGPPLPRID
jgi:DNA-binding GntR family transcriptional regulator